MPLAVLRCVFFLLAIGLATWLVRTDAFAARPDEYSWLAAGFLVLAVAAAIAIDAAAKRKRLETVSLIYFGTIAGLLLATLVGGAVAPVAPDWFRPVLSVALALALSYTCTSLLIQANNNYRFIIPFIELAQEGKGVRPCLLDTSAIIDGRVADVVETKILDNPLVVPSFVLAELQGIADSSDRLRRTRGRRGLDILNRLRDNKSVNLAIDQVELPEFEGQPVDLKLVLLAKHLGGKVVTNDYNLNKVAQLHGVEVVNLNDLALSLRPVYMPGESLEVYLVKGGEEAGQGIGYLDDGTMVVVEAARERLHQTVKVTVTSVLQTSAGRMIFGR